MLTYDFLSDFGMASKIDVNYYLGYPLFSKTSDAWPGITLRKHLSPQDALRIKALCKEDLWWIDMTEDDVRRVIWFLIEGWRVACAHAEPSSEPSQTETE